MSGKSVPLNYRIYNKQEGKTKNDYLREMIAEILSWGLEPDTVTTDAWYSSNLLFRARKSQAVAVLGLRERCALGGILGGRVGDRGNQFEFRISKNY